MEGSRGNGEAEQRVRDGTVIAVDEVNGETVLRGGVVAR